MALYIKWVSRKSPRPPYNSISYPIAYSQGSVSAEDFMEDMVHNTTLSKQEARMAIDYFLEAIPRYLAIGNSIQLGKMGFLKAVINSEGSESPDEALPSKIKKKRVVFMPGKELRQQMNNISVRNVDSRMGQ